MALVVYETLFDGLRGWYASFATERPFAGFSAAMALSFLFGVNLTSVFTISVFLLDGNLHRVAWLFGNKLLLLVVGLGIAVGHVRYAKSTGRYDSTEPPHTHHWKRIVVTYCALTVALLAGAILSAVASHYGG